MAQANSDPAPAGTMRALLVLAWPIVLARATQAVVGFCDALMVAPLGEESLAAVTTGALNTWAFVMLPMGTVFIVQSFAAQLHGRGELHAVRRYAWYGLIVAAGAGLVSAAALPFIPAMVGSLGYAPAVAQQMSVYVMIRVLSVGAVVGTEALGNWYGGLGNTRLAMIAGIVTMVTNVAGNYLLIEPRFGLPGFGATGAAWASVTASFAGFGVAAAAFAFEYGTKGTRRPGPLGLERGEFWRVIRFGVPNGVNWFLEFAAFVLFINVVVGHLGTSVLAAFNVVLQINSISFMPAFGLASAGAILVGNAIGARRIDRVWPIVRRTLAVACSWMATIGLSYWLLPEPLIGLFRPRDLPAETLVTTGAAMLALSAIWQLFDAAGMTVSEALRAAGDTTFCMNARIVLAWFVFMPGAWLAVRVYDGGTVAIMGAVIVYIALLAIVLGFRFVSGRWRDIDLLGGGELPPRQSEAGA
jgi:multidrug resistance protein, MATE family